MRNHNVRKRTFKVIVIGDSGVGKTSLTDRFCRGTFLGNSVATVGVHFKTRNITIDGEEIVLQLSDTAGSEKFAPLMRSYYRNAQAVVLVYDVTNNTSFENLPKWIRELEDNDLPDIPSIIVGNKCDEAAVVPSDAAQLFAWQKGMPFFETSAKSEDCRDNIEGIFYLLARKLKHETRFAAPPTEVLRITARQESIVAPDNKSCC